MVPSKNPSSTYFRKFSTVTGASFGNSSMVKEPCEVSNLTMVSSKKGYAHLIRATPDFSAGRSDPLHVAALRAVKKFLLFPLGLGHAFVPGEIAVGAYVTEAARDKLACDFLRLVRAVLEQQPAVTLQVIRGGCNDGPE